MSAIFSYTRLKGWTSVGKGGKDRALAGLRPHQRLILSSGGSLTLDLEHLLEAQVKVEVIAKGACSLDADAAAFLGETHGAEAFDRSVWLVADGRRVVFAYTVMPASLVDRALLESLDRYGDEPLGKVLNQRRISFSKEHIEAGLVRCPGAAIVLGMDGDAPLWARRYVLSSASSGMPGAIKAVVTEVFGQEIIPSADADR
ncbi:MAG: chorismate lyase [Deltaproteobacteria bacterium]|nr:chorismate lyase [Deltaproteobacteria bacterium]